MNREQVRAFDSFAINELGVPGVVLMENAGRTCAETVKTRLSSSKHPRVCIFCGTGNNGGDGYVIARHLKNAGFDVVVVLCGAYEKVRGDARTNLAILERIGQHVHRLDTGDRQSILDQVRILAGEADMIVDALFGTGLQGIVKEPLLSLIDAVNALGVRTLAVDIPSGLDCDTGEVLGTAVKAEVTVTFVAVKKGFAVSQNARDCTGDVIVASIGVDPEHAPSR